LPLDATSNKFPAERHQRRHTGCRAGTASDSNTGYTCEPGKIISVQLVGAFDTVTTGTSAGSGTSSPDTTVREVDVSVDATTGLTGLIGVRTEPVSPGHGVIILHSR